ncbi:MAG TPA: ABC transporter permease, partial [Cyclobacteriaceae bacterium]|nr:ABC transporter permease [Cyclobacteriaceae bacterium]
LLVTFRNLRRNGFYSFINISGLAIGITCSILIILWVADETSFDKFHPKADRLYQVWVNAHFDGRVNSWTSVPLPTYEAMKSANANIVHALVTDWGGDHLLAASEEKRMNKRGYYVSEEFLEMFQFPLIAGNAALILDDPANIVITKSTAQAFFGNEDAMGKIIRVDNQYDLKVAGILKDIPSNSTFQFDFLLPWKHRYNTSDWVKRNTTNWGNYSFQVFVELNDPKNKADAENGVRNMLAKHGEDKEMKHAFFLYPLLRWRLYSNFNNGVEQGGMSDYVQLFTVIAVFIIVIACINFMNLATARSERRAREVGIRKSVGSRRLELIFQFIGESIIIVFISFVVAVIAAQLLLPSYNALVEKKLFIDYATKEFWLFSLGLIFLTGTIAGSYPAFYLSGFQPVKVLKGKPTIGKGASLPRKVLVTLQFGFSILLIISMFVIYNQIQLAKGRDLGYSQENLITVPLNKDYHDNLKHLKVELLASNVVESMVRVNSAITDVNSNNFLGWPGKPDELKVIFTTIVTDYDWAKTMGVKMIEGRDFSEDFKTDSLAIIVNKAAIKVMGLKDPIGTELDLWGKKRKLIGVCDDVLMGSPYEEVKPMFAVLDDWWGSITVRLKKTNDLQASLKTVENIFKKYGQAYPFEYTFVDVEFQKKFTTINLTSKLASLFAVLAVIITGLGLFGLASFTAEQRTKEIGIRKVLGASVSSLVSLISKEFSIMVIVAFGLSAPLSWWLMTQYLERYAIRTSVVWWIFPLTGAIALTFALLIVSTQAMRAAQANPVNSLRNE